MVSTPNITCYVTIISYSFIFRVDVFLPNVDQVGGFSMYSPPALLEETGTIQLAVKKSTWPPAAWIHTHCQVGSKLSIRVGGDFYYEVPPKSQDVPEMLLIAGGVGINPLLSILRHITPTAATSPSKNIITLLYSAKNSEEILFKVYVNFFVLL